LGGILLISCHKINILWLKRLGLSLSDKYVKQEFPGKELDINKITVYIIFYPVKSGFLPPEPVAQID
jgi:hypothetical protein